MTKRTSRQRKGFTLIELLVVIAIIAILVALLLPAVQKVRSAAAKTQCKDHLHNIGVALHNYHEAHNTLPPGLVTTSGQSSRYYTRGWGFTWQIAILPYVEQKNLYEQYKPFYTSNSPNLWSVYGSTATPEVYRCPSHNPNKTGGYASYVGNAGTQSIQSSYVADESTSPIFNNNGVLYGNSSVTLDELTNQDGTAYTMLAGERTGSQYYYTRYTGSNTYEYSGGRKYVYAYYNLAAGPRATGTYQAYRSAYQTYLDSYYAWRDAGFPRSGSAYTNYRTAYSSYLTAYYAWRNGIYAMSSTHDGGINILFGDGAVRFITDQVNPTNWANMQNRRDGAVVGF